METFSQQRVTNRNEVGSTTTPMEASGDSAFKLDRFYEDLYTNMQDKSPIPTGYYVGAGATHSVCSASDTPRFSVEGPSPEVRASTPKDTRFFKCIVRDSRIDPTGCLEVSVRLGYAPDTVVGYEHVTSHNVPDKCILNGRVTSVFDHNGVAVFDSLSMCETSSKHKEREFVLHIFVEGKVVARSSPFYTYSHNKVLERRKNISLRTLSAFEGPCSGGVGMHIIGSPFLSSPSLKCVFFFPTLPCDEGGGGGGGVVEVSAPNVERFSETVLFFDLPPCPIQLEPGCELEALVKVTNDGRCFSPPLSFVYVGSGGGSDRKRPARAIFRSKM